MRGKKIRLVSLLILVLATGIITGTCGCHAMSSDLEKEQEITDTLTHLQAQGYICNRFRLDASMIHTDDITQTQIIMYPGDNSLWYIYDYNLFVQWKLSEAEQNPQDQYLQAAAAEIKSIGQEGQITMEYLLRNHEKMRPMSKKGYLDYLHPLWKHNSELEKLKEADWPGLSGPLTKEYLTPYTQKGIESQGTAIEVILAKLNKLDTGIPGSDTPALYESCREDKWKDYNAQEASRSNQ